MSLRLLWGMRRGAFPSIVGQQERGESPSIVRQQERSEYPSIVITVIKSCDYKAVYVSVNLSIIVIIIKSCVYKGGVSVYCDN